MDASSFEGIRAMSDEELEAAYDRAMEGVQPRADLYLHERHRRTMRRHSREIRNLTRIIAAMTLIVTVATVVNVVC